MKIDLDELIKELLPALPASHPVRKLEMVKELGTAVNRQGYQATLDICIRERAALDYLAMLPGLESASAFTRSLPYLLEIDPDTGEETMYKKRLTTYQD